ncbi:hypothetical protein [Rossellomorea yichunensis]|uniref:hypothetical protein n=1 Tax=Rossellomorea yichunensis TaxID=3077331 RepID=UPI0028DED16F|nr:hypothetical protein [Rossellomorea sp. YC4-1]MDT9027473.1 hypothetical protein [Rossellomorea sp. YC4-1]
MKHKPIAPLFFEEKKEQVRKPSVARSGDHKRKTRFDKSAPMKFPVTDDENRQFRRLYQSLKNELSAESITQFFTMLVRFGLRHPEMLGKSSTYRNTETHKTVKPNQVEKELLTNLSIEWNVSERKALHGVVFSVLSYIEKGGHVTREKVQPFRPNK